MKDGLKSVACLAGVGADVDDLKLLSFDTILTAKKKRFTGLKVFEKVKCEIVI